MQPKFHLIIPFLLAVLYEQLMLVFSLSKTPWLIRSFFYNDSFPLPFKYYDCRKHSKIKL